jgi:DNA-directed RNA polymerase subunit RPC12/RpoP
MNTTLLYLDLGLVRERTAIAGVFMRKVSSLRILLLSLAILILAFSIIGSQSSVATTTSPTSTTSPPTTTTPPDGGGISIDPMVMAAGVGVGAVAILAIVIFSQRRKPPRKAPEIPPTAPVTPMPEEVPVVAKAEVSPYEKTVKVLRGGEIVGGKFEYKVKVKNDTDYVINNVTVNILAFPEDCLGPPERTMKTVKRIGPGEFRSPQFTFMPSKDCVEGKVIATVSYIDHQDRTEMISVEPYVIRSVCDLLTPLESTMENFELILGDMVATSDESTYDWNPEVLFKRIKTLLPAKNFSVLDSSSRIEDGQFIGEIQGLAEGKYTGKRVALRLTISGDVEGNRASVKVEGLGDDEAMLPTTIDELTKGIDSWTCMNCGAALESVEVDEIRAGKSIQCRYCRHTMTIDLYRR